MDIQINDMLLFVLSIGFKIQTRVTYMINKDLHCQTIYFALAMHIYLILYLHVTILYTHILCSGVQRSDTTSENVSLL